MLVSLPDNILVAIAVELALIDPLGPPSAIVPLLLTCRSLHATLAFNNNKGLYANIFKASFDSRAAYRRMGPRAMWSPNLAAQLKVYAVALKRLRQGDLDSPHLEQDFWSAFLMCVENDGRNQIQLKWAGVDDLVERFVLTRLWDDRERYNGWPAESNVNALAVYILFMMLDEERIASYSSEKRALLLRNIRPYVITAPRYPNFHAPDNHFTFPLPPLLQSDHPYVLSTPHGFWPLYRQPSLLRVSITHFNLPLVISAPLIALGCKLIHAAFIDVMPVLPSLPVDRETAISLGRTFVAPTQADFHEANAHRSVQLAHKGSWDWREELSEEEGKLEDDGVWRKGLKAASARWDQDWARWTECIDPWRAPRWNSAKYVPGTLTGEWQGRIYTPMVGPYLALASATSFPENFSTSTYGLLALPLYFNLREHHCISPAPRAPTGGAPDSWDEGLMNGWFPSNVEIIERGGEVRVGEGRYITWTENGESRGRRLHDEETCLICGGERMRREEETRQRSRAWRELAERGDEGEQGEQGPGEGESGGGTDEGSSGSRESAMVEVQASEYASDDAMEEDDETASSSGSSEYSEYVETMCSGITDIILTGESLARHGQAWHAFRFYGRVRPNDGLISLVRVPVHDANLGVFIFRGYVLGDRNFTGSWRSASSNVHAIPFEGPFVASRVR